MLDSDTPTGSAAFDERARMNPGGLLTSEDYSRMHDDYILRALQIAFDEVDRGEVGDLDMKALLAEAHRRHAARQ